MKDEKGLSLFEVLISMLILSLGILGMAPLVVLSIESNSISRDVLSVSNLAKEKMEYYASLDSLPVLPYTETESNLDGGYNRLTFIQDNTTDTLLADGVCQVDIIISWTEKTGMARSTKYSTLLSRD